MIKNFLKNMLKSAKPIFRRIVGDPATLLEEMPDCPAIFHIYRSMLSNGHQRVPGGWLYEGEFYPDYLTVGGNTFAIRRRALEYCSGVGLDIGASYWPLPGSTPIDTELGPGTANRIEDIPLGSQNYVFSSHCLEHISDWQSALDCWVDKLKVGGVLFLYLPHPSCKLWHMSNPQMRETHKWVPTPDVIRRAVVDRELAVVDCDDGPDHFFSFYVVARKASGLKPT